MIDETTKFNRAEGYYKRDASMGNVDGAWKNFVANAKVQRSEMDNFNTPDLDQGADSILKPGETLEDDFDVTFRKANAEGGFQQLVQNTVDGSRPGYSSDTIEPNISRSPAGKFQVNYKSKYLGTFDSIEEAREIRDTAKKENPPIKNAGAKLSTEGYPAKVREILDSYITEGKDSFTFKEVLKSADITSPTEETKFRKVFDGVLNRKDGKEKYKNLKMTSGNLLSKEDRLKVQSNFDLPEGQTEWLFDKYKYGVDGLKHELLTKRIIKNIKTGVGSPLAATFGNAKGWMSHSMYRVYKNQTEPVIGSDGEPTGKRITKKGVKLTYEPLYGKVASGETKITGFKDNTAAGKGGEFYASKKHEKKGATNWEDHLDYEKVNKMVDITKRVGQEPSEMLQKLLTEKGFKDKVRLNDILSYDRYYTRLGEISPRELIKAQIVMHHSGGVGAKGNLNAAATKDIQLLTGANNAAVTNYENIVNGTKKNAPRALTTAENNILKNMGAKITGIDGTVYGGGSLNADKQFSLIEKQAADMIKKDTFNPKQFDQYLLKLAGTTNKKCKGALAYGGRVALAEGLSPEFCIGEGRKVLKNTLFEEGATPAQKSIARKLIGSSGKFLVSMLNPAELIKLKNLVGPGALGLMAAYEVGSITDDVLRLNKPLDEALAGNWLTKSFLPYSEEFAKQKNLLQSGASMSNSQKEYALEMMKIEKAIKEDKKISMMEMDQLTDQGGMGMIDGSPMIPQEKIDAAKEKFRKQVSGIKESSFVEGSARQLENKALMDDYEDAQKARTGASTIFGGPQRLVNTAPRPKNMGRGPMTEKKRMNLDFSIPGITPYNKTYTPSDKEISDYYQTLEKPRALNPGEGTLIRMGMGGEGLYGTQDKFAEGGLANLMKKYYDKR